MTSFPGDSIALTGCGWVTPAGVGTIAEVLTAARNARPSEPPAAGYLTIPDKLVEEYPGFSAELKSDKGAWVTAVALEHALRQAAIKPESVGPNRLGMVLGCALAGQLGMIEFANEVRQQSARFVSPIHFPQTVGNYIAGALARGYHITGPNVILANGAASALDAIIEACGLIAKGAADVIVAGGTEVLSATLAQGLAEPNVMLSEGACLFVLERADHAAARGIISLAAITPPGGRASRPMALSQVHFTNKNSLRKPMDGVLQVVVDDRHPPGLAWRLCHVFYRLNPRSCWKHSPVFWPCSLPNHPDIGGLQDHRRTDRLCSQEGPAPDSTGRLLADDAGGPAHRIDDPGTSSGLGLGAGRLSPSAGRLR